MDDEFKDILEAIEKSEDSVPAEDAAADEDVETKEDPVPAETVEPEDTEPEGSDGAAVAEPEVGPDDREDV